MSKEKKEIPNRPYVKVFDAASELLNPIESSYPNTGPNRRERRLSNGSTSTRPYSNKRGPQIFTISLGSGIRRKVYKIRRVLQHLPGKTLVHTVQSK